MNKPTLHDLSPGNSLTTSFPSHTTWGGIRSLHCTVAVLRLPSATPHWVVQARWRAADGGDEVLLRADLLDLSLQDSNGPTFRMVLFQVRSDAVTASQPDLLDQLMTELMPDIFELAKSAGAGALQVVLEDTMFSEREHRHSDISPSEANRQAFVAAVRGWDCNESADQDRPAGQPRRFFVGEALLSRWIAGSGVVPEGATRH